MSLNQFRAGSGSYQYVRPLTLTISAVPGLSTATETYSAANANIVQGAIADLTTDSKVIVQFTNNPAPAGITGLFILSAEITATGVLTILYDNPTVSTITPPAATQVNLIVL